MNDTVPHIDEMYEKECRSPVYSSPTHAGRTTQAKYIAEAEPQEEEVDVAEQTRQQLERMGICLDDLVSREVLSK